MKPFRFLHAADLHLDSPFRGMASLPANIRERIIESTFLALFNLIDLAISEHVDFVLLSGDIFDLSDRSLRAQIRFQAAMEKLAKHQVHVYIIHGNHDPLDGRRAKLSWPYTVHFFPSDAVQKLEAFDKDGNVVAHIYGISYPTAAVTQNLALQYKIHNKEVYSIALLHCNLDGDPNHERYAPCTKQELIQSGIHYWALGHVHSNQILHTYPHIVYPGNIQGRHARELGAKGVYIVDVLAKDQIEMTFHQIDAIRWYHETISIDHMSHEQELIDAILDTMEKLKIDARGRSSVVRLSLEGSGPLHNELQREINLQQWVEITHQKQLDLIESDAGSTFVWLESLKVNTTQKINKEELLKQDSFIGDLLRLSKEMISNEEKLNELYEQALEIMSTHPQAGNYFQSISQEERQVWLEKAENLAVQLLIDDKEWDR